MFISSSMVFEELCQHFECILHKKTEYDLTLGSADFLTKNAIPQKGTIYILDFHENEDSLSPLAFFDMAVVLGTPPGALFNQSNCLVELPPNADSRAVFHSIQTVLDHYQQWDDTLRDIVLREGTVEELLDCSTPIFGNPIGIHDDALECVFESDLPGRNGAKLAVKNRNRRKNADYIKNMLEDVEFQKTFQTRGACFFDSSSTKGGCTLIQNLFLHDQFVYRIVITERYRKLQPQDMKLLEHLSAYIKLLLTPNYRRNSDDRHIFHHSLISLLDGTMQDIQDLERHIRRRNWNSSDYFICVAFAINTIDVFGVTVNTIRSYLSRLIAGSEVFLYQEKIVAIIDVGQQSVSSDAVTHQFSEYMRDMNMKAGVSNAVQGLQYAADLYRQARIALEIGGHLWDYLWIYRFSAVAPYYIMERCMGDLSVKTICTPEIIEILCYDAKHQTDYFRTLQVYLECSQNLTATSAQLFIHRTTLLYRLEKLRTLFGIDEKDPMKRLYYQLSINLIQYTSYQAELSEE